MLALWIIIFIGFVRSSDGTIYSCDSNAPCGCSINPSVVSRVVNGEEAGKSTWSWAVSMFISGGYLCGGSILTESWIITAAHCVNNIQRPSDVLVFAGSNLVFSGNQSRIASEVIIHPDYTEAEKSLENDIALIRLSSPLDMSDSQLKKICLPSISTQILDNDEWPVPGTTVVAVGWGLLIEDGDISETLQQVTLKAIDYEAPICAAYLSNHEVQLCAGVYDNSKDTCQGDSGGPLMMFSSDRQWILVGLVSYGKGCARMGLSGVYTRVAFFQTWIESYVNDAIYISNPSPSTLTSQTVSTSTSTNRTVSTSTSTNRTVSTSTSTNRTVSTSTSTNRTVSTSHSTFGNVSTTAYSHANIVGKLIDNVFGFALLSHLVGVYFKS